MLAALLQVINGQNQKCAALRWLHMWVTEDQLHYYWNDLIALFCYYFWVRFIHMKLLIEQAFSHEVTFDKKAFKAW